MVVIRLSRHGVKHRPFYHIVVADSRSPRDGLYIEKVGFFNPISLKSDKLNLNLDRINYWIKVGAQLSDRVKYLLNKK